MSNRSISRRGWCAAAAATALAASTIVAASAPAGAAPGENRGNIVFRDHYTFNESHIEQEEHGDEFCDVPYLVLWEGKGTITDTMMVRRGERYFASFKITQSATYTNVETGASFSERSSFGFKDQKVAIDEDGILTATWQDRVSWKLFDGDGRLVGVDAGMTRYTVTVDLNDLDDPEDDEELSFEVLSDHGTRQLGERDFCEDVTTFLG